MLQITINYYIYIYLNLPKKYKKITKEINFLFFLYFSFLIIQKINNKYFSFQYKYFYLKNLLFSRKKKKIHK